DLGCGFTPARRTDLQLALVWRDAIAPRIRLDQAEDMAPSDLQLAASWAVRTSAFARLGLHVAVDRVGTIGWAPRVGLEGDYRSRWKARAGSGRQGVALGLGCTGAGAGLDYAFLSRADAGTHPVTVQAAWGRTVEERRADRAAARDAELRAELDAKVEPH